MDAGEDLHTHGNGQPNPKIASLPSAGGIEAVAPKSQPPQEAAPGAPASVSPTAGEKPASAPEGRDPKSGRFQPGKSGNPKGRTPGIPNLNEEICRAAKALRMGDKKYIELLLLMALKDPRYAELIVPRLLANATPLPAAGPLIDASDKSEHHHHTENNVRLGEHLSDAGTRDAVAELTQRLASRGAFAGDARHVRQ